MFIFTYINLNKTKMELQLKEALKLITEKCKKEDYYEAMYTKSLPKRIDTIHMNILRYIDTETLNYYKTQLIKKNPDYRIDMEYREVELSKKEIEDSIQNMEWMIRDLQSCINHLKEN